MNTFNIVLREDELNLIGLALGKMPYEAVNNLILNLRAQLEKQAKLSAVQASDKSTE